MPIRLYDFAPSPNCQRVKIALHEKGLAYDVVPVDLRKGEQKKPEFLELNPYGKVPVIVDEDTVLFESCIINEYLDEKYPAPPLMPKEPSQRGKARVLIDYGLNYIHPQYWTIRGEFMKPPAERDVAVIEQTGEKLRELLRYLERAIGHNPYFLGDFSLADIGLVTRFLKMESFGVLPVSPLPRLSVWLQRIKERPSVKAIL
ncbi:MAG: glutathione S-transferase family protein [Candidatus Binatia bacterium]